MRHALTLLTIALLTLTVACATERADEPSTSDVDANANTPTDKEPVETRTLDLKAAMGGGELQIVGVTVEPNTGRRLVLVADVGVYAIANDDTLELVWDKNAYPDALPGAFTDIAAIDEGLFALTAPSNGFLLDLEAGSITQHFCYEPGDWGDEFEEPALQITRSVAFDPETSRIVAQPQTVFASDLNAPIESFIAHYDRSTGQDVSWYTFTEATYQAGGMAVMGDGQLLLGVGDKLDLLDTEDGTLTALADLSAYGVASIDGLNIDPDRDILTVVDDVNDTLVEIRLSEVLGQD